MRAGALKSAVERAAPALRRDEPRPQLSLGKGIGVAGKTGLDRAIDLLAAARLGADALGLPLPDCRDKIGWIEKVPPASVSADDRFRELNAAYRAGQAVLPPEAKDFVYLFVGGLNSEGLSTDFYMGDNMQPLKQVGAEVHRVPIKGLGSVATNAAIVAAAIDQATQSGKRAMLICHSKGGIDATAALALHPELQARIRALITLATPYGGDPIAEDTLPLPGVRPVGSWIVRHWKHGDPKAFTDLLYESRAAFLARHPEPLGIPAVCVAASRLDRASRHYLTELYLQLHYGIGSDGVVTWMDAFIPGARTVTLQGLDHGDLVYRQEGVELPYHPADITAVAVAMALETPNPLGA